LARRDTRVNGTNTYRVLTGRRRPRRSGGLRARAVFGRPRGAAPPPRVSQQRGVLAAEIRLRTASHAVARVRRQAQILPAVARAGPQPQVVAVHAVLDRVADRDARHVARQPLVVVVRPAHVGRRSSSGRPAQRRHCVVHYVIGYRRRFPFDRDPVS